MGIGDLKPAPQALLKCLLQGKGGIDIFKVILERMMINLNSKHCVCNIFLAITVYMTRQYGRVV